MCEKEVNKEMTANSKVEKKSATQGEIDKKVILRSFSFVPMIVEHNQAENFINTFHKADTCVYYLNKLTIATY